ncbi:MAG: sulfite exporter TauE/SafE family protein [Nevskia sp.]|nr:sulfite exporter TauE/SafE family protein [Nevskia sp.]
MAGLGFSLAGLLVGVAVGATGVGGGSLMTPVLILFYGISPTLAVGTDLLYAAISKSYGVLLYRRKGAVDWPIVGWQALGSVPAALLTLYVLGRVGPSPGLDHLIKLVLSIAIIVTACFTLLQETLMLRMRPRVQASAGLSPLPLRLLTILAGVLIGTVVTISSVGAGVIGMMLLIMLYPGRPPIRLVGSDLAHAVLITAIAGIGHVRLGTVNYSMLLFLLLGALPGIWIGSRIGFRLDPAMLKRSIAVLLLIVGATTLAKAMTPAKPAAATASETSTAQPAP